MPNVQNYIVLNNRPPSFVSPTEEVLMRIEEKPKEAKESFWKQQIRFSSKKIKSENIVVFTQQFAGMINTGLTIKDCLEILIEQTPNQRFKKVINQIKEDITKGEALSSAFIKHKDVFPPYYPYLIKAGEEGGVLNYILEKQASFMERSYDFGQKIRGMFVYPLILLFLASIVVTFLLIKVFPAFATVYQGMNTTLPLPTRMLMGISSFITNHWLIFLISLSLIIVSITLFLKSKYFSILRERFFFTIPVFGRLNRDQVVTRFIRTFGFLISSGVPIISALEIMEGTMVNETMKKIIQEMKENLKKGKTLSETFKKHVKIFSPFVVQAFSVGERGGILTEVLEKTADFMDRQLDHDIKKVTTYMEPMITLCMGGVVAFVVVSMYLPMFSIMGSIGK